MSRVLALLLFATTLLPFTARADDYGPPRDVGQLRSDARRLLARQVRAGGADPKNVAISDVVVAGNQSLLSWDSGKQHGLAGFVRQNDRWWEAFEAARYSGCWYMTSAYPLGNTSQRFPAEYMPPDYEPPPDAGTLAQAGLSRDLTAAAALHNADVRSSNESVQASTHGGIVKPVGCNAATYPSKQDTIVHAQGGRVAPPRFQTSGYAFTLAYSVNDAASSRFQQVYFRPPTPAEFLPNHPFAPGWGGPNAVCYFDLAIAGDKIVTFKPGTVIDLWFPFVLDDQLDYSLSFFSNDKPSGMIHATIFDNTVHFVLPQFALAPGKPLMAEIDGDPKAAH